MGGRKVPEFTENDRELLVKIVKAAQSRKIKGSRGEWKDFLKTIKEPHRADPTKHPWSTLSAFVQTFTEDADIQMVKQIKAWEIRSKKIEELESEGQWRHSPVQELVWLTRRHLRFQEYYTFPTSDKGWVMTDDIENADEEHILSMDCEMVTCDDGEKEVVRVCVVDNDLKVMLDMLVKPTKPVIDYLTPITGICEADLKDVTSSFLEAQTSVLKLISSDTILVGHSLYNDLKALKIDHGRVIDTAFIFHFRNKPERYNAGLNNLCKAVLGYEFREDGKPHDCLLDATIPMRIVLHTLQHGIKGPIDIQEKMLDEAELSKLYFHSIPQPVSVNDLQNLIPKGCTCKFEAISWAKNKDTVGTTYGVFSCIDDANMAFEELKGFLGVDSFGRPQKTVRVPLLSKRGKSKKVPVKVRKMSNSRSIQGDNVSLPIPEDSGKGCEKKRKLLNGGSSEAREHCCEHLQEIESLNKQLSEKIQEVHALQNIIVDLSKEQLH